jgi:hypothetical protein
MEERVYLSGNVTPTVNAHTGRGMDELFLFVLRQRDGGATCRYSPSLYNVTGPRAERCLLQDVALTRSSDCHRERHGLPRRGIPRTFKLRSRAPCAL